MLTSYFDFIKTGLLFSNLIRIDAKAALTVTRVSKHKSLRTRVSISTPLSLTRN
jgi:hypothetical protein